MPCPSPLFSPPSTPLLGPPIIWPCLLETSGFQHFLVPASLLCAHLIFPAVHYTSFVGWLYSKCPKYYLLPTNCIPFLIYPVSVNDIIQTGTRYPSTIVYPFPSLRSVWSVNGGDMFPGLFPLGLHFHSPCSVSDLLILINSVQ